MQIDLQWIPSAGMQPGKRLSCTAAGRQYLTSHFTRKAPQYQIVFAEWKLRQIVTAHNAGQWCPLRQLSDGTFFVEIQ